MLHISSDNNSYQECPRCWKSIGVLKGLWYCIFNWLMAVQMWMRTWIIYALAANMFLRCSDGCICVLGWMWRVHPTSHLDWERTYFVLPTSNFLRLLGRTSFRFFGIYYTCNLYMTYWIVYLSISIKRRYKLT